MTENNEEYEYKCSICNSIVADDDKVCPKCGALFEKMVQENKLRNYRMRSIFKIACLAFLGLILLYAVMAGISRQREDTLLIRKNYEEQIEKISSLDPTERWYGANSLGIYLKDSLADPKEYARKKGLFEKVSRGYVNRVVPLLIDLVDDNTPLEWYRTIGQSSASFPTGARTTPGREAAEALKQISGRDFGQDRFQWEYWWEQNETIYENLRNDK